MYQRQLMVRLKVALKPRLHLSIRLKKASPAPRTPTRKIPQRFLRKAHVMTLMMIQHRLW